MQSTNNNPAFGHIVCQPIRRLQVKPDLPDRPHVRVNQEVTNWYQPLEHLLYCKTLLIEPINWPSPLMGSLGGPQKPLQRWNKKFFFFAQIPGSFPQCSGRVAHVKLSVLCDNIATHNCDQEIFSCIMQAAAVHQWHQWQHWSVLCITDRQI